METQTVDFYTAGLYLIVLSDHNDNFSKYNKKKMLQTKALRGKKIENVALHAETHGYLSSEHS